MIFEYILDFTLYELLLIDTLNYMLYAYLSLHICEIYLLHKVVVFFTVKNHDFFYIRCLIRVISEEGFRSEGHSMAGNGRHTHTAYEWYQWKTEKMWSFTKGNMLEANIIWHLNWKQIRRVGSNKGLLGLISRTAVSRVMGEDGEHDWISSTYHSIPRRWS